jgi:heptosyltransferase-2/heptosyltransferase-3
LAVKNLLPDWNQPFIVVHPGGGRNPGMVLDAKRWPAEQFATLADRLSQKYAAKIVVIGDSKDADLVKSIVSHLQAPHTALIGQLTIGQVAALAQMALLYIGNDTGLTHLAAASSARTIMILGPSDPARYAPFAPNAIALWKPTAVRAGGVAQGAPSDWNWTRDGISVDEAEQRVMNFMKSLKG